jgi:hypothetical protein
MSSGATGTRRWWFRRCRRAFRAARPMTLNEFVSATGRLLDFRDAPITAKEARREFPNAFGPGSQHVMLLTTVTILGAVVSSSNALRQQNDMMSSNQVIAPMYGGFMSGAIRRTRSHRRVSQQRDEQRAQLGYPYTLRGHGGGSAGVASDRARMCHVPNEPSELLQVSPERYNAIHRGRRRLRLNGPIRARVLPGGSNGGCSGQELPRVDGMVAIKADRERIPTSCSWVVSVTRYEVHLRLTAPFVTPVSDSGAAADLSNCRRLRRRFQPEFHYARDRGPESLLGAEIAWRRRDHWLLDCGSE